MESNINKPQRPFRRLLSEIARERADAKRGKRPRGFWTQIVYDYIVANPGCARADASRSIEPLRSRSLGYKIIDRMIKQHWITTDEHQGLHADGSTDTYSNSVFDQF